MRNEKVFEHQNIENNFCKFRGLYL
ncbi:unnamed protein product [Nezara viridula]|uniref:Uncharacterized protein n=1 Tax=Nezara viridula TaxID=85310 RepID=A0A9P0MST0_NEZVI|nr:unnamed protein product [Nezara viridula]